MIDQEQYSSRAEVAELLGVSVDTLRNMERRGEGPPVIRFSPKKALYSNVELVRYLAARTRGVAA